MAVQESLPAEALGRLSYVHRLWSLGLVGKAGGSVWALYGILAAIRDDLLPDSVQQQYRVLHMIAGLLSIPFAWWLVGLLLIVIGWLFEASYRDARTSSGTIASLRSELDNRARVQEALNRLWSLRKNGVEIRNRTISQFAIEPWLAEAREWRQAVYAVSDIVSPNLRNWLETLNEIEGAPDGVVIVGFLHGHELKILSEILRRLDHYLEKGL